MISYRKFEPGDEKGIIDLYQASFQRTYKRSVWDWMFEKNPIGRKEIILGFHEDQLVGQCASTPLEFHFNSITLSTSRPIDGMVHPDFWRRGIFFNTIQKITALFFEHEVDMAIGFPNDHALPAWIDKLKYLFVEDIYTYTISTKNIKEVKRQAINVEISIPDTFLEEDLQLINSNLSQYILAVKRTEPYLLWRFSKESGKEYFVTRAYQDEKLIGILIFKYFAEHNAIDLVDIFCNENADVIETILFSIMQYYQKHSIQITEFNFWMKANYSYYQALIQLGAKRTERKTHLMFKQISERCPTEINENTFYLSMSDSDVY